MTGQIELVFALAILAYADRLLKGMPQLEPIRLKWLQLEGWFGLFFIIVAFFDLWFIIANTAIFNSFPVYGILRLLKGLLGVCLGALMARGILRKRLFKKPALASETIENTKRMQWLLAIATFVLGIVYIVAFVMGKIPG